MQPLWRTVRSFLKKLKIELKIDLPVDTAIPLLGIQTEFNTLFPTVSEYLQGNKR